MVIRKILKPGFGILLLAVSISLPITAAAKVVEEHIYIILAGNVDRRAIEDIKSRLPGCLPMSVKVAIDPPTEMPEAAYDQSRKQYNAEMALDEISKRITLDLGNERALVTADVDLYSPDLNFVFGVADAKKGICIISLTRLRNEYYGLKPDRALFLDRAVKEAERELGHSLGLAHCSNPKCVMYFSNNLSDIDRKRNTFCHDCKKSLRRRYESPLISLGQN